MARLLLIVTVVALNGAAGGAAEPPNRVEPAAMKQVVGRGYEALKQRQNADGSFAPKLGGPGITALVAAALVRHGYPADDPVVAKALAYLERSVKPDGGVYDRGLANYTTCLAIMTFQEANVGGRYDKVIERATAFVRGLQNASADPNALEYGGAGYDGKSRPDLSNTQFFIEALKTAGVPPTDPAMQKALAFVSRSQNLPGEFNDQPFAKVVTDADRGGFVYNPLDHANEKSPKRTAAGGLRSEGGMTYAGLKSFLYAGVSKDDTRVKAAVDWVRRHYTLAENPGMGTSGLFYYYHTFAKAMAALGDHTLTDAQGVTHHWRGELFDTLKAAQRPNGEWANADGAFLESQPELATAFALLALSYCR